MIQFFSGDAGKFISLIAGIILLVLELFLPGIGIAGFVGVILLGIGIACVWMQYGAVYGLISLLISLCLIVVLFIIEARRADKGKLFRNGIALKGSMENIEKVDFSVDAEGVALTVLNPVGFAEIEGKRIQVSSQNGYINKGEKVYITGSNGFIITVEKK